MGRRILILAGAFAIVLVGGATGAQSDSGADNLAAGTGTLICCDQPMIHVNAKSGAAGEMREATSGSGTRTAAASSAGR